MAKNIYQLIKNSAYRYPKKIFLRDINDKLNLNYIETISFIEKFNSFLLINKIKRKEKIVVILDNSILLSLMFLSITGTNRVFVPINPDIGKFEFLNIIKTSNAKFALIDKMYKKKFSKLFDETSFFVENHYNFIDKILNLKETKINKNFKGLCEILYTSGSTGNPKGVMLTHTSIIENLKGLDKGLKLKKFKNFMAITPLFHNNGQFIPTLMCIKTFGSSLPVNSKTSVMIFWDLVKKFKINYSSVMSTHINYLLKNTKIKPKHFLKGLFCGGAKLDLETQNKFEKKYRVKIACNYGLTETSSIATTESLLKKKNFGSVGKPLFNNRIKIINQDKTKKGIGEIVIKGRNVFKGYINNRKKTRETLINNWLHTGDLGKFDNKRNLYIHDRKDNMIIVSGENIFPTEIEKFTNSYKNIQLSVIVPLKDEITQNKLLLLYEEKKKFKNADLMNFLKNKLSFYKLPKIIMNCRDLGFKEIPKASNGKILRNKIVISLNKNLKKRILNGKKYKENI